MKPCNVTDSARFLSGQMSDPEITSFEEHLEKCPICRQRLETDAGDPALWDTARELLAKTPPKSTDHSAADAEWLPDCTTAQVLSFVSPTDDPQMIGRIGPYEISALLGRGSAGIVLKGFDRALNRNVAIKVLDPALAGVGAARQRFAREARAMAAISHEHLVPVFEVNEHAGLPYFVMEYVPGGSLERRLRGTGPLEFLSVIRIGQQVALALTAAHRNGLVHRDIKPGNILLDSGTDRVRVADFGLVRISNDVSCSRSGIVAGTPQYMAPEQVRGEVCDGQSDLFSLGAVMYALCTGHPPFRADTVYGVMQRIAHDDPRSIREQNPGVPVWLEGLILRLLSKERSARFPSADVVAEILSREMAHLQNPRQVAQPDRHWMRAPAKAASTRRRLIMGLSATAVLIIGVALAWNRPDMWAERRSETLVKTGSTSEKPSLPEPASPVPLWGNDGTSSLREEIEVIETAWPGTASENDSWNAEVENVARQLQLLLQSEYQSATARSVIERIKQPDTNRLPSERAE